jgi:tubulin polyglutamylase TTLL4
MSSCHRQLIADKFNLGPDFGSDGNTLKWPVTYQYSVYSRVNGNDDNEKQHKIIYNDTVTDRETYLESILEDLTPNDLRTLIKAEEELSQTKHFARLFPTETTFQSFQYYYEGIPYYDKLMDAWETKYSSNRTKGIRILKKLCNKAIHL